VCQSLDGKIKPTTTKSKEITFSTYLMKKVGILFENWCIFYEKNDRKMSSIFLEISNKGFFFEYMA